MSKEARTRKWSKYGFEFLFIFVAVISAFMLNNWKEERKTRLAEEKILHEICNGLAKDLEDIKANEAGHLNGIRATDYFTELVTGRTVKTDSFSFYYMSLTRDFISIQNTSGYETLKSRGLELIRNDSLLYMIIELYEYNYVTLEKLEEDYKESQFHDSYFREINSILAPSIIFRENLAIAGIDVPLKLSEEEKKLLLSYLWKIKVNRTFIYSYYQQVKEKIADLQSDLTGY